MDDPILSRPYRRIAAFDLSFSATGWAICDLDSGTLTSGVLPAWHDLHGVERMAQLVMQVITLASADDTLVVLEDFAFAKTNKAHDMGGLGWLVRYALHRDGIPFVLVSCTQLKQFATDKGNIKKNLILLKVFQRFKIECSDDNQADAVVMQFIGRALLNRWAPDKGFTEAQKKVLKKIIARVGEPLEIAA